MSDSAKEIIIYTNEILNYWFYNMQIFGRYYSVMFLT